jgi:4Fe-4S ferredoxin
MSMHEIKSAGSRADCKQAPGFIEPIVNYTRCEGKGDCVRVCPESVFQLRRIDERDYRALNLINRFKPRLHGMAVAYTPNADACRTCGLCKRMSRTSYHTAPRASRALTCRQVASHEH